MSKLFPFWWLNSPCSTPHLSYFLNSNGQWALSAHHHTWFCVYHDSEIVECFNIILLNSIGEFLIPNSLVYGSERGVLFTGNGQSLTRCRFQLGKFVVPTATFNAKLYAYNTTTCLPEGSALATSTTILSTADITRPGWNWYDFNFDGSFILQNGVKYVIAICILTYVKLDDLVDSVSVHADESYG